MIGNIGLPEMIVIFLVALLLFGAKRLPEIARGLAQAITSFKKEVRTIQQDFDVQENTQDATASLNVKKDTSNDFSPQQQDRDWRPKSSQDSGDAKG